MYDELAELYKEIGTYIFNAIDEDWVEAWIVAEIEFEDAGTTYGRYARELPFDKPGDFKCGYPVYMMFNKLRLRMQEIHEEPWTRAVYTLKPTGKFHLDVEYGPLEGHDWERDRLLTQKKKEQLN